MSERMNKERAKPILLKLKEKLDNTTPSEWLEELRTDKEYSQALDIAIDSIEHEEKCNKAINDSAKAIAKMQRLCKKCHTNNEWVDVRDRLPINDFLNLSKDVLICNAEGEMFVAYYDYKKQCWRNKSKVFSWSDNIIAWKPLPEPYVRKE